MRCVLGRPRILALLLTVTKCLMALGIASLVAFQMIWKPMPLQMSVWWPTTSNPLKTLDGASDSFPSFANSCRRQGWFFAWQLRQARPPKRLIHRIGLLSCMCKEPLSLTMLASQSESWGQCLWWKLQGGASQLSVGCAYRRPNQNFSI